MEHLPKLDERLRQVMEYFPACDLGADIGADHGHLSCNLLKNGKARRMILTDISPDSLEKARKLFRLHHMEELADFRIGDGFSALKEPVDAAAICGMGGDVISRILSRGKELLCRTELVLCPQTDIDKVRSCLNEVGYGIRDEKAVRAAGRFYVVVHAKPENSSYSEKELFLGPELMKKKDPDTLHYYQWRLDVEKCVKNTDNADRIEWLEELLCHG